ncbi:MAG: response regulator [Myxococcales bacterium]|jgi:CheY-like chemotaxis protein
MRILIVDDDYVSRTQLKALLSSYGDCDAVPDGELALQMIRRAREESVPYELVTLDVEMPDMRGQEVLHRIRTWETENGIKPREEAKVLMVSALKDGKSIVTSFKEGCEAYLKKPVTAAKLREVLAEAGIRGQ